MKKNRNILVLLISALLIIQVVTILPIYAVGDDYLGRSDIDNQSEDGTSSSSSDNDLQDEWFEDDISPFYEDIEIPTETPSSNPQPSGSPQTECIDSTPHPSGVPEPSPSSTAGPNNIMCDHSGCLKLANYSHSLKYNSWYRCLDCENGEKDPSYQMCDMKNHKKVCSNCYSDLGSNPEPHELNENGYCAICKSTIVNSRDTQPEVTAEPASSKDAKESLAPSTVVTSSGEEITSSISTVNNATAVSGMAVSTPKQEVHNALGITDNTTSTSFYVCNSNKGSEIIIKKALEISGRKVYNSFNADMYSITKTGKIEKIHSSDKPVTLVFAIPAELQNKKFSIIAFNSKTGKFVEFKDTDNDLSTITIDATVFGMFTLVIDED